MPDAVSTRALEEMQAAGHRLRHRVRGGTLRHGYHQRSPGASADESSWQAWAFRGVYSPEFAEPPFGIWRGSSELRQYTTALLGCTEDGELFGDSALFISPTDADFSAGWHQDILLGTTAQGEAQRWTEQPCWERSERTPMLRQGLQYHLALKASDAFEIVPGSHRRPLSPAERALLPAPWGSGEFTNRMGRRSIPSGSSCVMPGGVPCRLNLQPGKCLFFGTGLLHNGHMRYDVGRLELHCLSQSIRPGQQPHPKGLWPEALLDDSPRRR